MTRELSPLERSMWMAHVLASKDPSLHLQRVVSIGHRITFAEVRRRLAERATHIDLLHASIRVEKGSTPIRIEGRGGASAWITEADDDVDVEDQVQAFVREPFDLATPPLLRVRWFPDRSGAAAVLAFVAHHTLFDARTFEHVVQVLLADVLGEEPRAVWPALDPATVPWSDADDGWADRLAPLPDHDSGVDLLPTSGEGATTRLTWTPDLVEALGGVQTKKGTSRATILLSLFAAAVHRVLDLSDVIVVAQVDVRPPLGLESLGMLVNTLPIRSRIGAEVTWQDFLSGTQAGLLHAIRHRYEPLEEIIRTVRPPRRGDGSSVFSDFEFSYLRGSRPYAGSALAGLRELPRPDPACRFGVSMNVVDFGDVVEVRWGTRLAGPALHDQLQVAVESLLDGLVRERGGPTTADIVSDDELRELFTLGTGPQRTVRLVSPTTLFRQVSAEDPKRPAVLHGSSSLTFRQLEARAAGIADLLQAHAVSPGDRVLLSCGRGPDHIAALVAVLHLGAVYVPCDPSNPPARAQAIAADALPAVALVDHATPPNLRDALREVCGAVVELKDAEPVGARLSEPTSVLRSEDPVYLLFTSGSTGGPKGVEVGLAAFLNHLDMLQDHLELVIGDRIGQTAPQGFDIHVWQALAPLLGATAVVFDSELRDPEQLRVEVDRLDVGILELVPSYLRLLCDLLESRPQGPMTMAGVRHVLTTGEALDASLLPRIRAAFPHATITNAYGPAEAADDVTLHVLREGEYDSIPLGFPAQNVELLVLDRWRRVRPMGLPGELAIGGPVLANGYVNRGSPIPFGEHPYRPGERGYLTGDIVVFTREHGLLFHGRSDDQVKLGGRRVELGEIESAIRSIDGVTDAAVAVIADDKAGSRLCGFAVLDASMPVDAVRIRLLGLLPDFMVPFRMHALAEIPRSPNGKLDRAAVRTLLPVCGHRRDAVGGSLAGVVVSAWKAVLGSGAQDRNFFDAGGDSLRAIDLVARLSARGIAVSARDLYQNQTLDEFAQFVVLRQARHRDKAVVAIDFDPTPRQRQMITAMEAGARPPILALVLDNVRATSTVVSALVALVQESDALRIGVQPPDGPGALQLKVRPFSAEVKPVVVKLESVDRDLVASDIALVEAAARSLNPQAGRIVGASYCGSRFCVAISHLVSDIATLIEVTAALADRVEGGQGTLRSSMPAWSREMSRRAHRAMQSHGAYVEHVAEVTRLQHASARPSWSGESLALVNRVLPLPDFAAAEAARVPSLVLAMVARAMFIHSGLDQVRLDLETDGRDSFSIFGVPGDGVGCFALLRPVVVSAADLSPAGLLSAVERAMAVQPPAWTWDAALAAERHGSEAPLPAVPLVNLIGRSVSLPARAGLAERVRVPRAVAAWNLPSEEHGLVIDIVQAAPHNADSRQQALWEAHVTVIPEYWPWEVEAFLTECMRSSAGFAAALGESAAPLPKGLDLLGIEEHEIGDLLLELGGDR